MIFTMVSVDVKQHWTMHTHWSQFVLDMSTRHSRTLSSTSSTETQIISGVSFITAHVAFANYNSVNKPQIRVWIQTELFFYSGRTRLVFASVLGRCVASTVWSVPRPFAGLWQHQRRLLRGDYSDKIECPFSGVTNSSRVWTGKVPAAESDARSVSSAKSLASA